MPKPIEFSPLERGRLFSVPLCETGGFGHGYIVMYRKGYGYLSNIYDCIKERPCVPEDIENADVILKDILHNHAQFIQSKSHQMPWIVCDRLVRNPIPAKNARFLVGSKVYDMESGEATPSRPGDDKRYRKQVYDLGNKDSMTIEAALRRRGMEFDKEIQKYVLT